jgi:succinoglycan biosynthesis transport protein ExoP
MTSTKKRGNALDNLGFLAPALRMWPIILVATLGGGLAAWGLSQTATPVYTATSSLYFSLSNGTSGNDLNQGSAYTQQQMLSFAQLAKSSSVLTPVVVNLGLDSSATELANSVSVSTPQNTVVLDIGASSSSPQRAADIANEIGVSLKDAVAEVAPTAVDGAPTVRIRTIDRASAPTFASAPNTRVNTIAGLLLGFAASTLLVIVLARLNNRLRRPSDIEEVTTLPVLAVFGRDHSAAGGLVSQAHPRTAGAETYRQVRAELENAGMLRRPLNVMVTASTPGEGTSTVARNLAEAFGSAGTPAHLVSAHDYVRPRAGASDLPTIVDTPAVQQTADAATLARDVDGIVVVVDSRQAKAPQLRQTIEILERSGGTIWGIVVTHTAPHAHRDAAGPAHQHSAGRHDDAVADTDSTSDVASDSSSPAMR